MYNSNGQLVVIGGVIDTGSERSLASNKQVWVYDPPTNKWFIQNVASADSDRYPSPASDLTAAVSKYLIIFCIHIYY